jgi:hypothetical protein
MRISRFILTICLFFAVISCRTLKRSIHREAYHIQSKQSHEDTSSTRQQLSEQWFGTASSLEHRDGSVSIDFDGPALIILRSDQTIEASGANPTIRSSVATARADTTVQLSAVTQLSEKGSASRSTQGMEASGEVERSDTSRATSLTPWIGAGIAVAIAALAVLWFLSKRR